MLERYFVIPETIDRIRASWIGELIEGYVKWMTEQHFASRTVCRRVPILMRFGEFARTQEASMWDELPRQIDSFVSQWISERATHKAEHRQKMIAKEVRGQVEQMLKVGLADFAGRGRSHRPENPFFEQAPGFFDYLRKERGLRPKSIKHYTHHLRAFARYLQKIDLEDLRHLSPPVLSGFVTELKPHFGWASLRNTCGVLRVFLRFLHRQGVLAQDLSGLVEAPHTYRLAKIPRSITWEEVRLMLESVDHHLVPRLRLNIANGVSAPRLHDLRHSFAVGTLLRWYRSGIDPGSRLLQLSTFLGHVSPVSTAEYLTITHDLLREASDRFERFASPLIGEDTP